MLQVFEYFGYNIAGFIILYIIHLSKFRNYWESMSNNFSLNTSYFVRSSFSMFVILAFTVIPIFKLFDAPFHYGLISISMMILFLIIDSIFSVQSMNIQSVKKQEFYEIFYFIFSAILVVLVGLSYWSYSNKIENDEHNAEVLAQTKKIQSITSDDINKIDIGFIHQNNVLSVKKDLINPVEFKVAADICPDDNTYSIQSGRAHFDHAYVDGSYGKISTDVFVWTINSITPELISGKISLIEQDGSDHRTCEYNLSLAPHDVKSIIAYGGSIKVIGSN